MKLELVIYRYEAVFFLLVLIVTGSVSIISQETEQVFPENLRYPNRIALTFDDGPYPGYTEKLLKVLDSKKVKATFFVIGRHISSYPELAELIVSKGHEIASHTYTHSNLSKLSPDEILEELQSTKELIKDVTGVETCLFRPPGGRFNRKVKKVIAQNGYKMVLWTVLTKDHIAETSKNIISRRAIRETRNNGIIVMHQGVEQTIEALPDIIDTLRNKGYKFVTVSQFLQENEPITVAKGARLTNTHFTRQ